MKTPRPLCACLPQGQVSPLLLSHLCKGGHCHDQKHCSTSQDLLLIHLFPYLAENQLVAKQRWWVLTSSAPARASAEQRFPHHTPKSSALL